MKKVLTKLTEFENNTILSHNHKSIQICYTDKVTLTMSVPKSIHKMVTVPSGSGMSQRMKAKKGEISGMLDVSV